jgi:hypothetical protein
LGKCLIVTNNPEQQDLNFFMTAFEKVNLLLPKVLHTF